MAYHPFKLMSAPVRDARIFRQIGYRLFVPPLLAFLLAVLISATGWERQLFLDLNHAGVYAGDFFWIVLTTFGDGLVTFVFILPFIRRQPAFSWTMVLAWLLVSIWTQASKILISSARPLAVIAGADIHIVGAAYKFHSFPSGHAAMAAALAASVCVFFSRRWLYATMIALTFLVCASRIVIGIHWLTDVLVGFGGGWLLALLAYFLANKIRFGMNQIVQMMYGLILFGAAIYMLFVNYSDYPQAFRVQQAIAAACILFTISEIVFSFRQDRVNGQNLARESPLTPQSCAMSRGIKRM